MAWISLFGIIIGLAVLIILAYRGVAVLLAAPAAAVVVILCAGLPVIETMTDAFMTSYANFAKNNYLIFFCSAILGKMMGDSGAARGIGHALAKIVKRSKGNEKFLALCAVTLVNGLLSLGGVGSYVLVFTMMTITKNLFQSLDVPWHMFTCNSFGSGVVTLTMIAGSPSVVNLIPTTYLGTTPRAAPVLGLIGAVIATLMCLGYFQWIIRKSIKEGEGFYPTGRRIAEAYEEKEESPPQGFLKSVFPTIVLLVVMNGLAQSPITAMVAAMAAIYILFRKELGGIKKIMTEGAGNGVAALASICSVVGFGGVVAATAGYGFVIGGLDSIPGPPIIQMIIAVNVVAGITGSSSGGLGVAMEQLSGKFLDMGIHPEVIHRMSAMAAGGLDSLPHNGSINNTLTVVKLSHREAYKHYLWTCTIIPIVTTFIVAIFAQMGVV